MICPNCGAEYRVGYTRCSDCDVGLVDSPQAVAQVILTPPEPHRDPSDQFAPPAEPHGEQPGQFALATVLVTTDYGLMAIAESLLRSAGIPFVSEGDGIIDLFSVGRIGGCNPITGPAKLRVAPQDADDARALLADLSTADDTAER